MKKLFASFLVLLFVLSLAITARVALEHGPLAALTVFIVLDAAIASIGVVGFQMREYRLFNPTLITSILTGKVAEAFRTKVPELSYFSTDFGRNGSIFAPPVKFGQEVISHLAIAPTAAAFTPGSGLGTGATNVKDLVGDIKVKIDQAAIVNIKLPTVDSVKYLLEPAFQASMLEAGKSLGRWVIGKVVEKFNKNNFSNELVATVAAAEYETLSLSRAKLNKLGALAPRFILGETDFVRNISLDPIVASGDYHGQRTGADPYITLVNIEGFESVREFPNMPSNTVAVGTVTGESDDDKLTLVAHGLTAGTRVRVANVGGALPTGLAAATDYYVRDVTDDTFKVAATPGGAAINLTGDGSGTTTVSRFEAINAFAGEKRSIHIAFRPLDDNEKMRQMLGIPQTMNVIPGVEAESGLSFTWYLWQDGAGTNPTGDIYAACVVAFGIKAGREIVNSDLPGEQAAGAGFDKAGLRIVESAAS